MGPAPVDVDLRAIWRQLGVQMRGRKISYVETAPLASVRRAITPFDGGARSSLVAQVPACEPQHPYFEPCVVTR
jgi:hypothetical protein